MWRTVARSSDSGGVYNEFADKMGIQSAFGDKLAKIVDGQKGIVFETQFFLFGGGCHIPFIPTVATAVLM